MLKILMIKMDHGLFKENKKDLKDYVEKLKNVIVKQIKKKI